jgi:hypothetical protein
MEPQEIEVDYIRRKASLWTGNLKIQHGLLQTLYQNTHGIDPNTLLSEQTEGTVSFVGGNSYQGSFTKGFMHAKGEYKWKSDNTTYSGDMFWGHLHGKGKYTWKDGSYYDGDIVDSIREGTGYYRNATTSSKYEGEWKKSKREGSGELTHEYADSNATSFYLGKWNNNKKNGKGVFRYPSGNQYDGDWVDNKKQGYGRMEWRDRNEIYEGEWFDNKPDGKGKYYWLSQGDSSEEVLQICW